MSVKIPLLVWLFQGIPECLALAALVLVLVGQVPGVRQVLLIGLPQAVAAYLLRLLPLAFGVHSIILIITMAALLNVLLRVRLSRGLLAALLALVVLITLEAVSFSLLSRRTGMTLEEVLGSNFLAVIYGWPHIILILSLVLFLYRRRHLGARRLMGSGLSD